MDYQVADVVPHDQPMLLLDRIVAYDDRGLEALVTIGPDSLFAEQQGVPSWVGIEYMGQAIAAFSGVCARQNNTPVKIGLLVGTRRYEANCSYFPLGVSLRIKVREITDSAVGLRVFACTILDEQTLDEQTLGEHIRVEANLNVFMPEDTDAFMRGEGR